MAIFFCDNLKNASHLTDYSGMDLYKSAGTLSIASFYSNNLQIVYLK